MRLLRKAAYGACRLNPNFVDKHNRHPRLIDTTQSHTSAKPHAGRRRKSIVCMSASMPAVGLTHQSPRSASPRNPNIATLHPTTGTTILPVFKIPKVF